MCHLFTRITIVLRASSLLPRRWQAGSLHHKGHMRSPWAIRDGYRGPTVARSNGLNPVVLVKGTAK